MTIFLMLSSFDCWGCFGRSREVGKCKYYVNNVISCFIAFKWDFFLPRIFISKTHCSRAAALKVTHDRPIHSIIWSTTYSRKNCWFHTEKHPSKWFPIPVMQMNWCSLSRSSSRFPTLLHFPSYLRISRQPIIIKWAWCSCLQWSIPHYKVFCPRIKSEHLICNILFIPNTNKRYNSSETVARILKGIHVL